MNFIRTPSLEDGILVFDHELDDQSNYDQCHLNALAKAEEKHFWFLSRREKIVRAFDQYVDKKDRILEIGGGTGFIAQKLMHLGYQIHMADIHKNGLKFAQGRGIRDLYQFDLFYPPFEQTFDVVCFFDVLEHLKNDILAIESIKKMLKPGGKIILTVPAHQWLWSRDDLIAGHARRYNQRGLEQLLSACKFKVIRIEYFFSSLVPLLLLRKWIRNDLQAPAKAAETVDFSISSFINWFLQQLLKVESKTSSFLRPSFGGSLIAVAELQ